MPVGVLNKTPHEETYSAINHGTAQSLVWSTFNGALCSSQTDTSCVCLLSLPHTFPRATLNILTLSIDHLIYLHLKI